MISSFKFWLTQSLSYCPVFWDHRRLIDINKRTVSRFIDKLFRKKLRSQTIRNIKNCLSAIMDYAAEQQELIPRNPIRGIIIPSPKDEIPIREPKPMGWNERDSLEKAFKENFAFKYYVLVITGHRTGLRIGELIGLKWCDIDWCQRSFKSEPFWVVKIEPWPLIY